MKILHCGNKITCFLAECISLFDLTSGAKTIDSFVAMVEELAISSRFIVDPNNITEQERNNINSFKGDMFEILAEIFFAVYPADPGVGLRNYIPVALTDDFGVDAVAINVNNDDCVVQCKYKSNPMEEVAYKDLAKTYSAGRCLNHFSLENNNTIFLFTTGKGANSNSFHVFGKRLRVINRSVIANYIDNNNAFWEQVEGMIMDTLEFLSVKT